MKMFSLSSAKIEIPCAKPWNLPITSAKLLSSSMVLIELSLAERSIAVTVLDFRELKNKGAKCCGESGVQNKCLCKMVKTWLIISTNTDSGSCHYKSCAIA